MKSKMRSLLWVLPIAPIAISLWVERSLSQPRPEFLLQRIDMGEVVRSVAPTEVRTPMQTSLQGADTKQTRKGPLDHGFFETRLFLADPQEADYGSRVCSAVEEAIGNVGAKVQGRGQGGSNALCTLTYRNENRHGELDVLVVPDSGSWRYVLVIATEV